MGERERKMTNQFRTFYVFLCLLFTAIPAVTNSALGQYDDDFNDNAMGTQWTLLEDDPATLNLIEQNQQLDIIANAPPTSDIDAIYLSNGTSGFKLSTAADFDISIDCSITDWVDLGGTLEAITLVLGVGRDLDGTDSAAIGVGLSGLGALGYGAAYRIDDQQTYELIGALPPVPVSDTLYVSYDAGGDDLTLGLNNGGSYTLHDTVVGIWNADSVLVSFGARGNGHTLAAGDASLDNFIIEEGDVIPIPEPASAALLLTAAALALRRKHLRKHNS